MRNWGYESGRSWESKASLGLAGSQPEAGEEPAPGGGPLAVPSVAVFLLELCLPRGGRVTRDARSGWRAGADGGRRPRTRSPPPPTGPHLGPPPSDSAGRRPGRASWGRAGPPGPTRSTVLAAAPPDPRDGGQPRAPCRPPAPRGGSSGTRGPQGDPEAVGGGASSPRSGGKLCTHSSPDRSCRTARFRNGALARGPQTDWDRGEGFRPVRAPVS